MLNNIKFIKKQLEDNDIKFWIDCGELLHIYRDKKLEKDDVDFGLMLSEYDKVFNLIKILEQKKEISIWRIWDKEISIHRNGIKFDFIFCTEDENHLYMYSYRKNPFDKSGEWNWEWRGIYPKDAYFPLSKITIEGLTFKCPGNIEKKLETCYGTDWKTPKNVPEWTYDLSPHRDLSYHPIAICMTTFIRDDMMMKIIPSYLKYPLKLYLIDQGYRTEKKDIYYTELKKQGHWIEYSDFDIGLSKARNIILDNITEPFVLMTEDDMELTTNPYSILGYFSDLSLGMVGGLTIRQPEGIKEKYAYELEIKDKILYYKITGKYDIIDNFFVSRRKVFDDVQYDENLKLAEHTDFFLQLKNLNKWTVTTTDLLTGNHYAIRPKIYQQYRLRALEYAKIMRKKWNITEGIYEKSI